VGSAVVLLSLTALVGADDHPAAPTATGVLASVATALFVLVIPLSTGERRRREAFRSEAADSPVDAGRGGGR
jgi:hypothetical protein